VIRNLGVAVMDAGRTPTSIDYVQKIDSTPGVQVPSPASSALARSSRRCRPPPQCAIGAEGLAWSKLSVVSGLS
jgi:hypothetical protein